MPGIVGIIGGLEPAVSQRKLLSMLSTMIHEPFYEYGTCFTPALGVAAGWVAHPHSYASRVCRTIAPEGVRAIVAGECFGLEHPEEPALCAEYSRRGASFVEDLNGQFSGLLLDPERRQVLLFNDRYGLERLYVHQSRDALYFATEAKALLRVLPDTRAFDDDAVADYLAFGCTFGNTTLFRRVERLEPATLWRFGHDASHRRRYFDPASWRTPSALQQAEYDTRLADLLKTRAIPRYVRSGEAVGLSLTGGLDMRMIMAALPHGGQHVAYTFSGLDGRTADDRVAAKVAAMCGVPHHILTLGQDFLAGFRQHVDRTVYLTDGYAGPLTAHEIYLNALARQLSPIRVTGNYGSEVLRGVSGLKPRGLWRGFLNRQVQAAVIETEQQFRRPRGGGVAFAAFTEVPDRLFGTWSAAKSQVTFRTPYLDNELVALAFRAPSVARIGPESSLNVVRSLDPELSEIATDHGVSVGGRGIRYGVERLLAKATFKLDYLYTEGLPARLSSLDRMADFLVASGVLGRHKYLPYRRWFRTVLAACLDDVLTDGSIARLPYLHAAAVADMGKDHASGRKNLVREIDVVLTLEAVDRLVLRGTPPAPVVL